MASVVKGEKSFIDATIDSLPFEIHVPNFQFLGPGTKLAERLALNQTGINPLDRAALAHDLAYSRNEDRRVADKKLIDVAFSRIAAKNSDSLERSAALMTACCLVSKITLEKFCSRVRRAFRRTKRRKNVVAAKKKEDEEGREKGRWRICTLTWITRQLTPAPICCGWPPKGLITIRKK